MSISIQLSGCCSLRIFQSFTLELLIPDTFRMEIMIFSREEGSKGVGSTACSFLRKISKLPTMLLHMGADVSSEMQFM